MKTHVINGRQYNENDIIQEAAVKLIEAGAAEPKPGKNGRTFTVQNCKFGINEGIIKGNCFNLKPFTSEQVNSSFVLRSTLIKGGYKGVKLIWENYRGGGWALEVGYGSTLELAKGNVVSFGQQNTSVSISEKSQDWAQRLDAYFAACKPLVEKAHNEAKTVGKTLGWKDFQTEKMTTSYCIPVFELLTDKLLRGCLEKKSSSAA
jgi:hypothetical protein